MKKIVVAASALLMSALAAQAADMPLKAPAMVPSPALNWSGFYVGVNGGYGWGTNGDQLTDITNAVRFNGLRPEGGFGGLQAGYNWQFDSLVLGLEGDVEFGGMSKCAAWTGNVATSCSKLDTFGTLRGRMGIAWGSALIYGTVGLAAGGVSNTVVFQPQPGQQYLYKGTPVGVVVGGGLEYAFAPSWTAKVEYQYINLGLNEPIDPANQNNRYNSGYNGTIVRDNAYNTVRVGVNYKFGGPGPRP